MRGTCFGIVALITRQIGSPRSERLSVRAAEGEEGWSHAELTQSQ